MYLIGQLEIWVWVLELWNNPRQVLLLDLRNNNFLSFNFFDFRLGNFLKSFNLKFFNLFFFSNKTDYFSWTIFNLWGELDNEVGFDLSKINNLALVLRTQSRHIFFYSFQNRLMRLIKFFNQNINHLSSIFTFKILFEFKNQSIICHSEVFLLLFHNFFEFLSTFVFDFLRFFRNLFQGHGACLNLFFSHYNFYYINKAFIKHLALINLLAPPPETLFLLKPCPSWIIRRCTSSSFECVLVSYWGVTFFSYKSLWFSHHNHVELFYWNLPLCFDGQFENPQ